MTNKEAIEALNQFNIECSSCETNKCLDTDTCLVSEAIKLSLELLGKKE